MMMEVKSANGEAAEGKSLGTDSQEKQAQPWQSGRRRLVYKIIITQRLLSLRLGDRLGAEQHSLLQTH